MKRRGRRATIGEVLESAIELERKTMRLYTIFVATFKNTDEVRRFWFTMARHEAGHCGALALVESLLDNDPSLAGDRKVWFDETTVARLRTLLGAYTREARRGVAIERALAMALDIESSELEDVVVDLLRVVKDRRWRDQAAQMLLHDLGDLSFMIEKYTQDVALLARADELVEERAGGLRVRLFGEAPKRDAGAAHRRPRRPGHTRRSRSARARKNRLSGDDG